MEGFGGVKYAHANTLVTCDDSNHFSAAGSTIIELSHCWTSTVCKEAPETCPVGVFPYGQDSPVQFGPVCGHPHGPVQINGRLVKPDMSTPGSTTDPATPAWSSESFENCQEMSRAGKVAWDLEHIQFSSYDPMDNPFERECELPSDSSSSHLGLFPVLAITVFVQFTDNEDTGHRGDNG